MFYLTTHSTHFIYGYLTLQKWKEKKTLLSPFHGLFFQSAAGFFFNMPYPRDRTVHTTAFDTPAVDHWLKWKIAQWVHHERLIWMTNHTISKHSTMELHHASVCVTNEWMFNDTPAQKLHRFLVLQRLCYVYAIQGKGKVLFNNTLNTFYLWLYGIGHMVKDHRISQKGNYYMVTLFN